MGKVFACMGLFKQHHALALLEPLCAVMKNGVVDIMNNMEENHQNIQSQTIGGREMRKVISTYADETICDITGKKLKEGEGDFGALELPVLVVDKDCMKESKSEGYDPDNCYESRYISLDVSPEISYEILKFLLRKYPNLKKTQYLENCKIKPWM